MRRIHKPLPSPLAEIARGLVVRVAGHDLDGNYLGSAQENIDAFTTAAINNAMVLRRRDLISENLKEVLEHYSHSGWQLSRFKPSTPKHVWKNKGYSTIVEYRDGKYVTPIGAHTGFQSVPRKRKITGTPLAGFLEALCDDSLPNIQTFTGHLDDTWQIWRTTILEHIESVREEFNALGITIAPILEGHNLHRLGAGQATKVVAAEAAQQMDKTFMQLNIGQIVRPDTHDDIMAENEPSVGSNSELFNEVKPTRSVFSEIKFNRKLLAEVIWRIFRNSPAYVLRNALRADGALKVKGVDTDGLVRSGGHLGRILMHPSKSAA